MGASSPLVRRPHLRADARGQSGVSLLEVLVGVAIMVPLTLASVNGMFVQIKASDAAQRRQELEVVLATATEDVKSVPYLACGSADQYQELYAKWAETQQSKLIAAERPPVPKVTEVSYWNRGKEAFTPTCTSDDGAQRMTLAVVDESLVLRGSIVKRDAAARVGSSG